VKDRKESAISSGSKRRWPGILGLVGFFLFLAAAAMFIIAAVYFRRAEPIMRKRVVETLSTRFDSRVELASFNVSVVRGFEVTGGGLKLYPNHLEMMKQPLFSVDTFSFRTGWHDLLRTPMHIGVVRIHGLSIHMPPKQDRKSIPKLDENGNHRGKIQIVVDELQIDHASIILGTNKPGKVPLDFEIANLRMHSVGAERPMQFHAILTNPKPLGNIDSTGSFGPFNTVSPGDTPVTGSYSFTHADLSTLKGIGGILSSTGQYEGVLNRITVDGTTDTPDFRLTIANHPMPLHTKFHAIVDGTNGDTQLQPVDAMLAGSHIVARGDVMRVPDRPGHNITLDVTVGPADIQDMLQLSVKTMPPIMNGALTLHTSFYLPPGKASVTDKLQLKGNFDIKDAHFSNPRWQEKINELSLRSQGHAEEAKEGVRTDTASDMQGNFAMGGSKLTMSGLTYSIPGAQIALNGVYSLDGNQFDFHGTARTQAKISQMVTGWKSLLLKPVDPFFAKNGAGTEVPISITGTRSDPHFGLDFGHHDEKPQAGKHKDQPKQSIP
jgi:hypothetical protein